MPKSSGFPFPVRFGPHRIRIDEFGEYAAVEQHRREMLYRALNTRSLVIFAGAGCSASLGYPSWQQFALRLIEETQKQDKQLNKLTPNEENTLSRFHGLVSKGETRVLVQALSTTQKIYLRWFHRCQYNKMLQELFSNPWPSLRYGSTESVNVYDALLALPTINRFVTSNYDCELDKAVAINREIPPSEFVTPYDHAVSSEQMKDQLSAENKFRTFTQKDQDRLAQFVLAGVKDAENMVFHCHGHFADPDSMVVSEADYRDQYLGDRNGTGPAFRQTLNLLFGSNPILFLGYGLNDEDLLRPLRMFIAADAEHKTPRPIFALMPLYKGGEEEQNQQLDFFDFIYERYGINVITFGCEERGNPIVYGQALNHALQQLGTSWKEWWEDWIKKPPFRKLTLSTPGTGGNPTPNSGTKSKSRFYYHYLPVHILSKEAELAESWIDANRKKTQDQIKRKKVIVLTGAGGVGKSWLAMNLLKRMEQEENQELFDGYFFWSSYYADDSLTGIDRAIRFIQGRMHSSANTIEASVESRYAVLEHYLHRKRYFLVFDGIERFLRETDVPGTGIANSPGVKKFFEIISSPKSKSVVILTTRLWPAAFNTAGSLTERTSVISTIAEVPIRPLTSSDLRSGFPGCDPDELSRLCVLLDGHVYALALARAVVLNARNPTEEIAKLIIALARTPSDRRTSRMIRESLKSLDEKQKISQNIMERLSLFARPVRLPVLKSCWKEMCARNPEFESFELAKTLKELLNRHLLQEVRENEMPQEKNKNEKQKNRKKVNSTGHKRAYAIHPMVREYFFRRFHHTGASQAPNLTLPGFTAAAADCHPIPHANDALVRGIFDRLLEDAKHAVKDLSGSDRKTSQSAIELCRSLLSLVRSRMGVLTIPRWSEYPTYSQSLARLVDLTRSVCLAGRWTFADRNNRHKCEDVNGPLYEDELAWLYNELGLISYAEGPLIDALPTWDQAYTVNRAVDGNLRFGYYTVQSLCNLGAANIEYGYLSLAEQYLQDGLRGSREMADSDHEGRFLGYLALIQHLRGNLTKANEMYDGALKLLRHQNPRGTSIFLLHWADLKCKQEKAAEAEQLIQEARALAEAGRYFDLVAYARLSNGHLLRTKRRHSESLMEYHAALFEAKRIGIQKLLSDSLSELSRHALALGDVEVARQRAIESLNIANQLGLGLRKTHGLVVLGLATLKVGQRELGCAYLKQARRLADQQEYWLRMAEAEEELFKIGAIEDVSRAATV